MHLVSRVSNRTNSQPGHDRRSRGRMIRRRNEYTGHQPSPLYYTVIRIFYCTINDYISLGTA